MKRCFIFQQYSQNISQNQNHSSRNLNAANVQTYKQKIQVFVISEKKPTF